MDEINKIVKRNESLIEALKNLTEKLASIETELNEQANKDLHKQVKKGQNKQTEEIEEKVLEKKTSI